MRRSRVRSHGPIREQLRSRKGGSCDATLLAVVMQRDNISGKEFRLRNASGARRHSLCISDLSRVADIVASCRVIVACASRASETYSQHPPLGNAMPSLPATVWTLRVAWPTLELRRACSEERERKRTWEPCAATKSTTAMMSKVHGPRMNTGDCAYSASGSQPDGPMGNASRAIDQQQPRCQRFAYHMLVTEIPQTLKPLPLTAKRMCSQSFTDAPFMVPIYTCVSNEKKTRKRGDMLVCKLLHSLLLASSTAVTSFRVHREFLPHSIWSIFMS